MSNPLKMKFLHQVRQGSEADPWLKRDGISQRFLDHRDGCYWYADGELLYIPEAGELRKGHMVIWVKNAPKSS